MCAKAGKPYVQLEADKCKVVEEINGVENYLWEEWKGSDQGRNEQASKIKCWDAV